MSRNEQTVQSETEEQVVTDWRMVAIGAGFGGFCFIALAGTLVFMALTKKPVEAPAPVIAEAAPLKKRAIPPRSETPVKSYKVVVASPVVEVPPPPPPFAPEETVKAARVPAPPKVIVKKAPEPMYFAEQPVPVSPRCLDFSSEEQLIDSLRTTVREIDFNERLGKSCGISSADRQKPLAEFVKARPEFEGLPLQLGKACETSKEAAAHLAKYSREVRQGTGLGGRRRSSAVSSSFGFDPILYAIAENQRWQSAEAIPALEQILQPVDRNARMGVVRLFGKTKGPAASAALARRAVFDVSADVRDEAIDQLRSRPRAEYRPILLAALRHPWVPAADHAAEAIIALNDTEAVPDLAALLDLPPVGTAVKRADGKWEAPELVRLNHLRNCTLCHAASTDRKDIVRGPVPTPGKPLPLVYYNSEEGDFVRADIVYLRQDFSVLQPVENAKPWPEIQRFDYLVMLKTMTEKEVVAWRETHVSDSAAQRWAVLTTLRALAGYDAGNTSQEWKTALAPVGSRFTSPRTSPPPR